MLSARLLKSLRSRVTALQLLVLSSIWISGCGRPSVDQMQSDITAAVEKIGPTLNAEQLAAHRTNISEALSASFATASEEVRQQLLQHCQKLVAKEFRLTFGHPTIAEIESAHFLATLGGLQETLRTVDIAWGDRCFRGLVEDNEQQSGWLQDEATAQPRIRTFLTGLQAAHTELLRSSGRAVTGETMEWVLDRMLETAFLCRTVEVRFEIVTGLLELWPGERLVTAGLLDQRLQRSEDEAAIAVYEKYSSELQLSVPLAVLRRQLMAAATQGESGALVEAITAYQQRAEQTGISADGAVGEALQTATRRSLGTWGVDDREAAYLESVRDRLSSVHLQLSTDLQQQIEGSLPAQLQAALSTGDAERVRGCLLRAGRLGLNSERQRSIVEELTSADTAEASLQRLLYVSGLSAGSERMTLLRSVVSRQSTTMAVLRAVLAIPQTPAEWALLNELLREHVSSMPISAEDLFLLAVDLPSEGPRTLFLSRAFQQRAPDVGWLRILTKMQLTDAEVAELRRRQESATGPRVQVDADQIVSLLREAPSAALSQLLLSYLPEKPEYSLSQLRQLLTPAPVPGLQQYLAEAAGQAIDRAAMDSASPSFTEALEFYERFRESLQLTATPALLQAAFENSVAGGDSSRVVPSLRELSAMPELLTEQNGRKLAEFIVAQLRRHAVRKEAVDAATVELLMLLKTHFAAEQETVSTVWTQLLLADSEFSEAMQRDLATAESSGFVEAAALAETLLLRLRSTFPEPASAVEFQTHIDQLTKMQGLFEGRKGVEPLMQAEEARWTMLLTARIQAIQEDYAGLGEFQPVLEQAGLESLQGATALRLLELSPLEDDAAIRRDTARYLRISEQQTEKVTREASRRLLRYAIIGREWSLAEQQLRLLKSTGPLDTAEQAAESSLQNVFFGLQLARSWQGRRIPINIVRTVEGRRQQINIDLLLKRLNGEEVSGVTAIEELRELGTFSGRIGEAGLELTFTGDSLQLQDSRAMLSVTLGAGSVRNRYDDIEFSGMDQGCRLLVGELEDGDMLFLDLPRNRIPLKPHWEGLGEYGVRHWFVPPNLDENNRLYFQTAVARNLGGAGQKLTFSIGDLTKLGDVTIRGDLISFNNTNNPPVLSPEFRFLRNAELTAFATETIQLRPNTGDNRDLGRHYGRRRIELQVPQGTRLLIIECSANGSSQFSFNGISLELPEAAVPVEAEPAK